MKKQKLSVLIAVAAFLVSAWAMAAIGDVVKAIPEVGPAPTGLVWGGGSLWLLDRNQHLILPTICLSITSMAFFSRLARSSLLEVVRQDFVRTARAKGLTERAVLFRHALRNALIPMVTLLGLLIPAMISGSVIIERIFAWPGTGRLYFDAILSRDYPMIMGLTLFTGFLTLVANLLADLLYAVVDPRVRYS